MSIRNLLVIIVFMLFCSPPLQAAQKPDDREALQGLKTAKVIFDVRVPDLEKLLFNLNLLNETYEGIVAQKIKPQMIVVFRGPGVRLLTDAALDDEARKLFRDLKKKGVRFEACAVAMRVFKADPEKLYPEINLVANVFNSLIGYQNKGYAMIAIN
ncbi:MAG: DsrE family protein [Desulfuromonadaceae bacterium]|nr:DsrE family protein [Desulfuromonadaceae bacterium]